MLRDGQRVQGMERTVHQLLEGNCCCPSNIPVLAWGWTMSVECSRISVTSKLEVGSMVEVDLSPQANQFGVIKWIGNITKSDGRLCLAAGM